MCPRNSPSLHSPLAMHLSTERENSQRAFISRQRRRKSGQLLLSIRRRKCSRPTRVSARARPSLLGLPVQFTTYTCPHSTQHAGWVLARQCLTCSPAVHHSQGKSSLYPLGVGAARAAHGDARRGNVGCASGAVKSLHAPHRPRRLACHCMLR